MPNHLGQTTCPPPLHLYVKIFLSLLVIVKPAYRQLSALVRCMGNICERCETPSKTCCPL